MNLRDLHYLTMVAKTGHFTEAAERCFVSQPTLSAQIKKLEDELGIPLFERDNKHVRITKAGAEIVKLANEILDKKKDIEDLAKAHQNPYAGSFILGAFPTLAPFLFPRLAPDLTQTYPEMKLFLLEDKSPNLIEKCEKGDIDLALLADPVMSDKLTSAPIFKEAFTVAVSHQHPMAKKKSVSIDDLRSENLLLLEEGHCLADQALDVCTWVPKDENTSFRATSIETLRQMVAINMGVTLMPAGAIDKNLSDPHIAYIPIKPHTPYRHISLYWRKTSPYDAVFKEMASKMSEIYQDNI